MKKLFTAMVCALILGTCFPAMAANYPPTKVIQTLTADDQNRIVACFDDSCKEHWVIASNSNTKRGFVSGTEKTIKNNRIFYLVPGGWWTEITESMIISTGVAEPSMVQHPSVPLNSPEATSGSPTPLPANFSIRNFKTGEYEILPAMEKGLYDVVAYAKSHPQEILVIMGYVSDLRYDVDNDNKQRKLVMNRAKAVYFWLRDHGVPGGQMVIQEVYAIGLVSGSHYQNQRVDIWTVSYAQLFERLQNKPCDPCPTCPEAKKCEPWQALPGNIKVNVNMPDYCVSDWKITSFDSRVEEGVTIIMIDATITVDITCKQKIVEVPGSTVIPPYERGDDLPLWVGGGAAIGLGVGFVPTGGDGGDGGDGGSNGGSGQDGGDGSAATVCNGDIGCMIGTTVGGALFGWAGYEIKEACRKAKYERRVKAQQKAQQSQQTATQPAAEPKR